MYTGRCAAFVLAMSGALAVTGCGSSHSGGSAGDAAGGGSNAGSDAGAGSAADAGVATCLDATESATFGSAFTIEDPAFCAVAIYTAPASLGATQPSWGSHHGPLTVTLDPSGGGVTLERWTVPAGATGTLGKQMADVAAGVPSGAALASQAIDLPFFNWTAIGWTGPAPATTGAIEVIANGSVAATYTENAVFAFAGVSDGNGQGRLLFTGLSPLGSPSSDTNGVYAADACSSPVQALGAGSGCNASALISGWDDEPGPLVVDKTGNGFAVLTSVSGTQEARGFSAANVARGEGATAGVVLFTVNGFAGSLAAITPTATNDGVLVFQPFNQTTFDALDVVAQKYTAQADIAASGTPSPFLHVPVETTGLSVMTDDTDRLWVAYSDATTTTYVVLARVP